MAALPQCDAYGLIYDPNGSPDVDKLVIVLKVVDAAGNPISFEQRQTFTDQTGAFHFTLPRNATVTLSARASGIFADDAPVTFVVPDAPIGQLILSFPPSNLIVAPPLTWSGNILGILKATSTQDGYLSATDYVRFNAATNGGPKVATFNSRSGDVFPVATDYQSFYLGFAGGTLTGPLTLAADPTTALGAATRQYVDTKFASGVAGVATFNGRTGAVLPILGDYSSFYAPIAHTHTRSQITDLAVFSTSQPGLVPQPTTADAAKVLTGAGTWAIQAAGGGGTSLPGAYLASDFKASGSKLTFTGTIAAGALTTLTLTAASDFAVGQGIFVAGAGASGAPLITKVDAIDATLKIITLHVAATAAVTSVNVQHDDTVAIQTAINTVFAANGGEIYFAQGFYRCNGPLGSTNSVLYVPHSPLLSGPIIGISLIGSAPSFPAYQGPQTTGVIFQTDRIGANANSSLFAVDAWIPGTDYTVVNNLFLQISGICFRTYDNPQISALDLGMCGMTTLTNITCDVGLNASAAAQPTHGTFGLRIPRTNTAGATTTTNIFVSNYHVGFICSEIWCCVGTIGAIRCNIAFQIGFAYHALGGVCRWTAWECPRVIEVNGECYLDVFIDFENRPGGDGWWAESPGNDFYDPGNHAHGFIRYLKVRTGPDPLEGTPIAALVTGFDKCTIMSLGGYGLKIGLAMSPPDITVPNLLATTHDVIGQLVWNNNVVSSGANDSATAGFRDMRIPNAGTSGLTTGLVSYWKMDELGATAPRIDQISHNSDLTPQGGISGVPGRIGNATACDGTGNLFAADNPTQNVSTSITVTAWIKIDTISTTQPHSIIGKFGAAAPSFGWVLFYDGRSGSGNQFQWAASHDGTNLAGIIMPMVPTTGVWHFLCGIYDQTAGQLRLSIDNGTPTTIAFAGPIAHVTTPLTVLSQSGLNAGPMQVDEIGWWSRALTPTEITTLYASGAGISYPF